MKLKSTALLAATAVLLLAAPTFAAEGGGASIEPQAKTHLITAIVQLIVFVVLLLVLTKAAWGPISTGLAAREAKIREDIETAERARREGEAALASYKQQIANADAEVRAKLATAQQDAEAISTRLKMDAQREIEEMKTRASREIEETKNAALVEVRQQAATLSTAIAGKILKRNINEADQADLIRSSLEELQVAGRR